MEKQRRPTIKREDWDQRYAGTELVWTARPSGRVAEAAVGLAPGRALDLAAGEGRHAVWLAEQGWQVLAVDFSAVGLEKAQRLAEARGVGAKVAVAVADLEAYQPQSGAFDLVLLAYLQMGPAQLGPIVKRAAQALAPGGTFLLLGHDLSNLAAGHGGPQDAGILYTAADVVAALDGQLELEAAGPVERKVATPEGERTAIDCYVRAKKGGRP